MKTSATIKTDTSDVYPQSVPMPSAALRQELPDIGTWADGIGSWYQTLKLVLQRANAASVDAQANPIVVEGNSVLGRDNSVAGQPVSLTADTEGEALVFTNGVLGFSTLYITYIENLKNTINTKLSISENLSDIADVRTARVNLGLGTAAVRDVPGSGDAGPGQVVLGNDTRLTTGGGGGGAPTGPAGGDLSGTYPNPSVNQVLGQPAQPIGTGNSPTFANAVISGALAASIIDASLYEANVSAFSVSGAFTLNLTIANRMFISVTGNTTFSSAGFSALFRNTLIVHNPTGSTFTLAWPGWTIASGALPTSIFPGASFIIDLEHTGSTVGSVYACLKSAPPNFAPGSYGDATHTPVITVDGQGRVSTLAVATITGGSGGSAGGDLTGTYPNPTLAAIGSATGPIGDATHVAQVTIDAKGRVTGLSSVAISGGGGGGSDYPFSVKAYGALGDGSTNDTTAIQNAANALTAAGNGTLFFPDGRYIISSTITVGNGTAYTGTPPHPNNANFTICGSGMNAAVLIQVTGGQGGISVNLTGGSAYAWNRADVFNLGLRTANGVTGGTALHLDYGATALVSSEIPAGSFIHHIDIGSDANGFSKGWTSGIVLGNPWKYNISDIHAFGCADSNVIHSTGAGSGAAIQVIGGFNGLIDHVYGSFWLRGIQLDTISGSYPQGILMTNIVFVAVVEGLRTFSGGAGLSNIQCVNWLIDQGNSPNNSFTNVAFYIEGDAGGGRGNVILNSCSILQVAGSTLSCGIYFKNVSNSICSAINYFNAGVDGAVVLDGNSMHNVFDGCYYASAAITCRAGTDGNQFNNIQSSTFTNLGGGGNVSKTTLW